MASKTKIIKPTTKEVVTYAGKAKGIRPEDAEDIQTLLDSGDDILGADDSTERDTKPVVTEFYDEFVCLALEDAEHHFKAFAERDVAGKTIRVETQPYYELNNCMKELRSRIDSINKSIKPIIDYRLNEDPLNKKTKKQSSIISK